MDMIACPACGTESKAGTKFCRHCGKEIPASGPMDGQSTIAMGAMTPPPPANDPLKTVVAGMAAVPPRPTAPPAQATVAMGAVTAPPPANDPNKTVVAGMSAVPPASTAPAGADATIAMGAVNTAPPPPPSKPSLAKPNDTSQNDPLKTVVAGMAAVPPAANPNYGSATVVQSAQTGMPSPNYGDQQGYPQGSPYQQQPQPAPSNKGGSKIVYILLALVALGFLAGIGLLIVFLVLGSMNAKTTSPTNKPSSPSTPSSPTRTASEPVILDKKLTKLELCSFTSLPSSNTEFNQSTVGTTFSKGVSVIRLKVVGKPDPGDSYTVTWKQGGQTAVTQTIGPGELKSGTSIFLTLYKQSGNALPAGNYSVELENDNETAGKINFTIE